MTRKFWNWARDADAPEEQAERTLYINGPIATESWWGDEVTPKQFKDELNSGTGPVTCWIDSEGGDVFAAAIIYNALMDYPGQVTMKIGSLAASAASVIAMAGSTTLISPVGLLLIHNPSTIAIGDSEEMKKAAQMLDEVKESIINAYQLKSGMSRKRLSEMMNEERFISAKEAVSLGLADGLLFDPNSSNAPAGLSAIFNALPDFDIITLAFKIPKPKTGTPIESLDKRLSLISH